MKRFLFILAFFTLLSGQLFAQLQVEGTVENVDGVTLPGVNVTIKGTTTGTITDLNGHYTISDIPADGILVYSFMGMLSEEIMVGDQTVIDVMLIDDIQSLEEIVVVGYGTVKRANLTGAVADINADKLEDIPSGDVASLLEGRLAGVKVGPSGGTPGSAATITIRTTTTFGEVPEKPLYVIDGVVYGNDLHDGDISGEEYFNQLDASEIESISILKDASAAVYGSRSTAGVILVKTKQGQEGKTSISYNGSFGISKATQYPEMLSAFDHATMLNHIYANDATVSPPPSKYDYYTEDELEEFKKLDYNWVEELWKPATINRHNLNVSGGTEKVKYFIGGNYFNETGNLEGYEYDKYSFRSNINANIAKGLTASLGISTANTIRKQPENAGFNRLITAPRWVPPVIDGKPVANNNEGIQPYGALNSGSYNSSSSNNSQISASLKYDFSFVKGLSVGVNYNYNYNNSFSKKYNQTYTVYQFYGTGTNRHIISDEVREEYELGNNSYQEGSNKSSRYQLNANVSYGRTFGGHKLGANFIYEQTESQTSGFQSTLTGANVKGIDQMWAFDQNSIKNSPEAKEAGRLGFIGRLNYSYLDKYILEATFRADASIKFHPDWVWGYFPAVSAGWIMSEENFFKNNIRFVNFFKLRGSAGRTGNDGIRNAVWRAVYNGNQEGAMFGTQTLTSAITPNNNGDVNEYVTWSKSNYYNGGFDARFLNSKIDFGFDAFYRYTFDILAERRASIPTEIGLGDQKADENYGRMYAKGFEFSLGYNGKITRDINYYVSGNFSYTKHRKIEVDQNPAVIGRWDDQLLNDPSNKPGWVALGMIRNEADLAKVLTMYDSIGNVPVDLGMLYYADIHGENYSQGPDGKLDGWDRTIIAELTAPPYNYGFSLGASWKGLKIDLTFTGEFGHKVFIKKNEQVSPTANKNVLSFWGDYWTPENTDASMPRPYKYGMQEQNSTFWMRDGNTLRLSVLNIGYSLPKKMLQKISVGDLRIYFTARNLWTVINPYDHKDPSVSDAYSYPLTKSYNFGIKLTI